MGAFATGLLLVPLVDHALKLAVRDRLGSGTISLGPLGSLRVVSARIWWARRPDSENVAVICILWLVAASALAVASVHLPLSEGFAGLLIGGAFSNGLEASFRGSISDFVCLRFWPAFNLADVAIAMGAIGLGVAVVRALGTW
jgi:hypothetical protein